MIPPDLIFLALAGIAFLGFVLDALFHRLRVASILPLMLLGLLLVVSGVIPPQTISVLNSLIPYVSALTIAFILFAVGLEIRITELSRIIGRATAFTFSVQITTGLAIALLAYGLVHWSLLISLIFGFALSGPSSIAVPVLVRVAQMPEALRTSLLYESVISDVLQILVPILMIGLLVAGSVSTVAVASSLLWTVLGSAAGGAAAAVAWLFLLDRLRDYAKGYTWTLTITMVLATYGLADRLHLSPALVIFVFGLTLGNAALLDFRHRGERLLPAGGLLRHLHELRERLGLSTRGLDIPHILQVQREVSFFASSFFFVYIGLLFEGAQLTPVIVVLAGAAAFAMLAMRALFSPILAACMDPEPAARRSQRGLVLFNLSRGLAAAVVATIPQGVGIVIPGFLDGIFLGILLSTVVSTIGIFVVYQPARSAPEVAGFGLSTPSLTLPVESMGSPALPTPGPTGPPERTAPALPPTGPARSPSPAPAAAESPPRPPLPSPRSRKPRGTTAPPDAGDPDPTEPVGRP